MKRIPLRSRIRAVSTTLFLLLFPAIFYYLSPVIPIVGSTVGIITGSLIVFAVLFVVAMVLGRGFCAYVCPGGTLQDHVAVGRARQFPRRALGWIKYVVWAVWLATLAFFFRRAGGVQGVSFAYQTEHGLSVTNASSLIAYLMVISVFFGLSLAFGRRAACHTICWMAPFMVLGRKLGLAAKIPSLRIASTPESCVDCGICDAACPMSLEVSRLMARGGITSADCILCGKCVDACPKKTLSFSWR